MKSSGLQKRVLQALQCIINKDLEEAFFHLAPAIDASAKRHYPSVGQRERYTKWLDAHQVEMFTIATHGRLVVHGGFGNPDTKGIERVASALYKARCAATHDPDELDELVTFIHEEKYGFLHGRFIITQGMLIAFTLLVLSDPKNKASFNIAEFKKTWLQYGDRRLTLIAYVGKREELLKVFERKNPAAGQPTSAT